MRLPARARRNHWWNVPFHLTGRGTTTRPMRQIDGNPVFTIDFDFVDHVVVTNLDGRAISLPRNFARSGDPARRGAQGAGRRGAGTRGEQPAGARLSDRQRRVEARVRDLP
ncbi:DUF5996 family protein [Streptomyces sp. NPDC000880]